MTVKLKLDSETAKWLAYEFMIALGLGLLAYSAVASRAVGTLDAGGYALALRLSQGMASTPIDSLYSLEFGAMAPLMGWGATPLGYVHFLTLLPMLAAMKAVALAYFALRMWKFARKEAAAATLLAFLGTMLLWPFYPTGFESGQLAAMPLLAGAMLALLFAARSAEFGFGAAGNAAGALVSTALFAFAAYICPASAVVPAGILLGEIVEYRKRMEEMLSAPLPILLRALALVLPIIVGVLIAAQGSTNTGFDAARISAFPQQFGFAFGFALVGVALVYWREKHPLALSFATITLSAVVASGFGPIAGLLLIAPCAYGIRALFNWNEYAPLLRMIVVFVPAFFGFYAVFGAIGQQGAAVNAALGAGIVLVMAYLYEWEQGNAVAFSMVFGLCAFALMFAYVSPSPAEVGFLSPNMQNALAAVGNSAPGASVASGAPPSAVMLLAKGTPAFANEYEYSKWLAQNIAEGDEASGVPSGTVVVLSPATFDSLQSTLMESWSLRAYNYVGGATDASGVNLALFYTSGSLIAMPIGSDGMQSALPARILDSSGALIDFVPLGQASLLYPERPANSTGNMLVMPGKDYSSRVLALFRNADKYGKTYQNGTTFAIVLK